MAKKQEYKVGQKIRVDGLEAIVLDVLATQLYVEWMTGQEACCSFLILTDTKIEVE